MIRVAVLTVSLAVTGIAMGAAPSYEKVEAAAMKGDYQAQRNLAYGYASFPYAGQKSNPMLACAWYVLVLYSGDQRVGAGDVGNVKVYCGKLDQLAQEAAVRQARRLYKTIYRESPSF